MNGINNQAPMRAQASIERAPRAPSPSLSADRAGGRMHAALHRGDGAGDGEVRHRELLQHRDQTERQAGDAGRLASVGGGHSMTFTARKNGLPTENVKNVVVKLPPGLIGNPTSAPRCEISQLDVGARPVDSQIGTLGLTILGGSLPMVELLYNMSAAAGRASGVRSQRPARQLVPGHLRAHGGDELSGDSGRSRFEVRSHDQGRVQGDPGHHRLPREHLQQGPDRARHAPRAKRQVRSSHDPHVDALHEPLSEGDLRYSESRGPSSHYEHRSVCRAVKGVRFDANA